jgi:hypothetical protein
MALAALASCGGGGGGGGSSSVGSDLIDLTAANRETVAHATTASLVALGVSTSIPVLNGRGSAASGRSAARESAMGMIAYPAEPCAVAGRILSTLDDLNGNGRLDLGEPLTIVFEACQDSPDDVVDGTMVMTPTGETATSRSATTTMLQLSTQATNGRHSMTRDGSVDMTCTDVDSTSVLCTSTATTPVRTALRTHLFTDTVTLRPGFVEEATFDQGTGHVMSRAHGTIDSTAAGGAFSVSTDAAIGLLYADPYPHEGRLRVQGDRGTMLIAPQSTAQVRIDLDSADDGTFESSELKDWDWLL